MSGWDEGALGVSAPDDARARRVRELHRPQRDDFVADGVRTNGSSDPEQRAKRDVQDFRAWCRRSGLSPRTLESVELYLTKLATEDPTREFSRILRQTAAIDRDFRRHASEQPPLSEPKILQLLQGIAYHERGRRAGPHTPKDIVHAVRRSGITTAKRLQDELHYKEIEKHLKPLLEANILERLTAVGTGKNNRTKPLQLHPTSGVLIGAEVTNDQVQVAVTDAAYRLLPGTQVMKSTEPLPMKDHAQALGAIADLIAAALVATAHSAGQQVVGVGLCLPGPIRRTNENKRIPASRSVLPDWRDKPIAETLEALLAERGIVPPRSESRTTVVIENDASAGALGAFTQALRNHYGKTSPSARKLRDHAMQTRWSQLQRSRIEDLIYLRVTQGFGAGVISKGHLVSGGDGFAGELAHARVNAVGPICPSCGGLGCLETLCSEQAFVERLLAVDDDHLRRALEQDGPAKQAKQTLAVLKPTTAEGDCGALHPAAQQALWDAGWHVGLALAHICGLLNPKLIVFGGAMTETDLFRESVIHAVQRNAVPQVHEDLVLISWADIAPDWEETRFTPELLGSLATVVDECGDGFYLDPVSEWADAGGVKDPRGVPVHFDIRTSANASSR